MTEKSIKLNNGTFIPAIGLGTWQSSPGQVQLAVTHALLYGYRHIDAAYCYQNEVEVGRGLADAFQAGVQRQDVFVTTKLWSTFHSRAEKALDESLENLGLDYVDLYLMHWPVAMNPKGNHPLFPKLPDGSRDIDHSWSYVKTYKLMEKLLDTGKVKAIGVANFSVRYLEELLRQVSVVPAVNQIENHPFLPQLDIVDFCRQKGIHVTACSPLGSAGSPLLTEESIKKIADGYRVSPSTILISFHISRVSSVLAKSVNPLRINSNKEVVKIDSGDLNTLKRLAAERGFVTRYLYPEFGVDFGFPDKSG
ncbi:aldo/keto reductase family protein [Rhexocercosporidium sp. MPI-PUGE-AT-0058]|nr:aldo/keto reductase family protein [Rhexocercosporidium sp. MPI-PUGE-AT-0058]